MPGQAGNARPPWILSLLTFGLILGAVTWATLRPRLIELRLRWVDAVAPPSREMVFEGAPAPKDWNGYPVQEIERDRLRGFLVRTDDDYFALLERDPHLGCRIKWVPSHGRFENPCHGERYTIEGLYLIGPAPRGMDRIRVIERADGWYLDLTCLRPGPPREGTEPGPCLRATSQPMTREEAIRRGLEDAGKTRPGLATMIEVRADGATARLVRRSDEPGVPEWFTGTDLGEPVWWVRVEGHLVFGSRSSLLPLHEADEWNLFYLHRSGLQTGTSVLHRPLEVWFEQLEMAFETVGLPLEAWERVQASPAGPPGPRHAVPGGDLWIVPFDSDRAARSWVERLSPDGWYLARRPVMGPIAGSDIERRFEWPAPPHVYGAGRFVLIYLGEDPRMLEILTSVAGSQLAGGRR